MLKQLIILVLITILAIVSSQLRNDFQPKGKGAVLSSSSLYSVSPTPSIFQYIIITETPVPTNTPRPTPKPTASPIPTITPIWLSSDQLNNLFTKYAQNYGVNRNLLIKIAICESYLNPAAVYGDYGGMYQFATGSWIVTRRAMNLDTDPKLRFNPEEAIKTAAYKIKVGGLNSWPSCGK